MNDDLAKQKGVPGNENLDGSYVSHHVSDVSGVGVSLRSSPFEQARVIALKISLLFVASVFSTD